MNKPTKEEMLEVIDCAFERGGNVCDFPEHCEAKLGPFACSKAYEAIRSFIENMDKKASGEVWNKWTARIKDDHNLGPMHIIYLVKAMLEELGIKVEQKEGGDE